MDKINLDFIFDGEFSPISYVCKRDDYIDPFLHRYSNDINRNIRELSFEHNGSIIPVNSELTFRQINNNDNSLKFLVNYRGNKILNTFVKSQYVICPQCKLNCLININDYNISLYNCYKEHSVNNLSINEFVYTQYIDESMIQCGECKINKARVRDNNFYICSCGLNLCPLCQIDHKKNNHNVFNFDKKNYWCIEHNEKFISYCPNCKYNLCLKCELRHNDKHKLIEFKDILPNRNYVNQIKGMQNRFRESIDNLEEEINKIVKILHGFLDSLNSYYHINEEIIKNYECKFRNYYSIKNVSNYNTQRLLDDISNALKEENLEKKIKGILDINSKINTGLNDFDIDKGKNFVTLKYKKNSVIGIPSRMRIFGDRFVEENYNKCYLVYNNKEIPLVTRINYVKENEKDNFLEIKLIETKKITSMNSMFGGCKNLISLDNFCEWDTSNVTDMSYMFNKCISLRTLPDISKWNTYNVVKMNGMFDACESLLSLPDISKWDVSNVTDMNHMFSCCKALKKFPNVSKWNTSKVTNMNHMFSDCKNAENLPDISQWNTSNVINMKYMFFCFNK
jgi:surface protein